MTPEQLREQWDRAQQLEAAGALDEARAAYSIILAASPRQIMVQLRLSALEQAAGRYCASRLHALQAGETISQTQRWEGLPHVTLRLLAFDERELVQRMVLSADWSSPQVLAQAPTLSQHLDLCGREEEALRLLAAADRRVHPSHLLEYSRADALRHRGRMDEATAAYERCIALAPSFPHAHWSLAHHAPASPGLARVARIRRALADPQQNASTRTYLHYALFKELDAAGEVETAWTELQAGAELRHAMQPYDAAPEEAGLTALMNEANRLPRAASATAEHARVPIFIVGMPRTGTTVLERILGGHTRVADGGELNDFQHAASLASNRFIQLPLGAGDLAALANVDPGAIGRNYLERTGLRYAGKSHLIDKNPLNFFAAGLIAKALPQARILCLVRDPVDACFSNLKELFAPGAYGYSYDLQDLADHYARFRRLLEHWRSALPEQFHVVAYEDLVADPVQETERAMRFCGLPPEPECADITRNLSRASTASSSQVRQPIHARNVGAWRRYRQHLQPMIERLRQHGFAVDGDADEPMGGNGQ